MSGTEECREGHELIYRIDPGSYAVRYAERTECKWVPFPSWDIVRHGTVYKPRWRCIHSHVCSRCGCLDRTGWEISREECPDSPGQRIPRQVREECARLQAASDAWMAEWNAAKKRNPVRSKDSWRPGTRRR